MALVLYFIRIELVSFVGFFFVAYSFVTVSIIKT